VNITYHVFFNEKQDVCNAGYYFFSDEVRLASEAEDE